MRPRPDGSGVGIAVGLEELGEPDGRVDGQDAALEGFDGDAPADGEEEAPEALDSHDGWRCSDGDGVEDGDLLGAGATATACLPFGRK